MPADLGHTVLATPMQRDDAHATTVGDYLHRLLTRLWDDGDTFDGKRPFGNSDWPLEVAAALIASGLVSGSLDEHGYVTTLNEDALEAAMHAAIDVLFAPDGDRVRLGVDMAADGDEYVITRTVGNLGTVEHHAPWDTTEVRARWASTHEPDRCPEPHCEWHGWPWAVWSHGLAVHTPEQP